MKALKLLTYMKASINNEDGHEDFEAMSDDELKVYLDEAISELEALQQPKSCDGCKHYKFTYNSNDGKVRQLMTICSDCFRRLNRDNYEPKE